MVFIKIPLQSVSPALQGQHISIPLPMKVRRNDKLFIIRKID